jgi:hypothetical protein
MARQLIQALIGAFSTAARVCSVMSWGLAYGMRGMYFPPDFGGECGCAASMTGG